MNEKREEGKKIEFWAEPEKRLKFLISLLVTLTVVFVFLAANSPEGSTVMVKLRAYRKSMESHRRFQQSLALDPPIGTNLKQIPFNLSLNPSNSLPLLVIVFGGCEGCGAQRLSEWAGVFSDWVQKEVGMGVVDVLEEFLGEMKGEDVATKNLNALSVEMRGR